MSNPSQRTVSLSAAAVIAAIVLFLVVQDQRHGWPFSRHMVQPASEHSSSHASATARSAATRVPVEIPAQHVQLTQGVENHRHLGATLIYFGRE